MAPVEVPCLAVQVVYASGPGAFDSTALHLPVGSRLCDAIAASGVLLRHGLALGAVNAGIWNRAQPLDTPLREGDRVELYRPLRVDPKVARRERQQRQRSAT